MKNNPETRTITPNFKFVDRTHHSCCACRVEFSEVRSAFDRCRVYDGRSACLHPPESDQTSIPSSLCVDRQTLSDRLVGDLTSDSDTSVSSKCDLGNVRDSLSCSEESGDEATCPPAGMLLTTGCVICLESYKC
jgi:hypothetical protein